MSAQNPHVSALGNRCTATSKRTGEPCQRPAMNGKTVCYHHGGATPVGFALPQTKTGRHSKYLPQRLQERYSAALDDPDLLNLTGEIVLVDARLADLLQRVDSGESGRLWKELQAAWDALEAKRTPEHAQRLRQAIARGRDDYAAWDEIAAILRTREKLVASERKRLIEMQSLMDTSEALTFARALAEAVKRHVHDPDALRAISAEIGLLIRGGS